jgi:hypothetical protein
LHEAGGEQIGLFYEYLIGQGYSLSQVHGLDLLHRSGDMSDRDPASLDPAGSVQGSLLGRKKVDN